MSGKGTHERRFSASRYSQELPQLFSETIVPCHYSPPSDVRFAENTYSQNRTSDIIAIIDGILEETSSRDLMNFGSRRERRSINAESLAIRELNTGSTMTSLEYALKSKARPAWRRYFSENDLYPIRCPFLASRYPHDRDKASIASSFCDESTRLRSRISVTSDWDDDAQTI